MRVYNFLMATNQTDHAELADALSALADHARFVAATAPPVARPALGTPEAEKAAAIDADHQSRARYF